MTIVYLSTDSSEAEELLSAPNLLYDDLSVTDGEHLRKRIGFNPMSTVTFQQGFSEAQRASLAAKLHSHKIFFAIEDAGNLDRHMQEDPADETLLRLYLAMNGRYEWDKMNFLFHFATHPTPQLNFNYFPTKR